MTLSIPTSEPASLDRALALLHAGEPIAFPTDTVYGVGASALDAAAVARLYTVKRRPLTQAIPLLIADDAELALVALKETAVLLTPLATEFRYRGPLPEPPIMRKRMRLIGHGRC
jgi:tRNA A37 threonylcarbamoyladenosine synthetase subunit TsaC/SUA5/YrdC